MATGTGKRKGVRGAVTASLFAPVYKKAVVLGCSQQIQSNGIGSILISDMSRDMSISQSGVRRAAALKRRRISV